MSKLCDALPGLTVMWDLRVSAKWRTVATVRIVGGGGLFVTKAVQEDFEIQRVLMWHRKYKYRN